MTISKINGFTAPYRSDTFQKQAGAQTGRNGILSMDGPVSSSGGSVAVPPFSFIQRGLIVQVQNGVEINLPTVAGPYHLVVSAPTSALTDDLIYSFVKSPADLTNTDTIISSYDGVEWHQPRFVSIDGIIRAEAVATIAEGRVGPVSGLQTSYSSGVYTNSPGVLNDQDGERQAFREAATFAQVPADADFSRVDKIVYRRGKDAEARIGTRQLLVGGTYSSSPAATAQRTGLFDNTAPRSGARVVLGPDNTVHVFAATGYGGSYQLTYTKLSSDRQTTLVAQTTLASMSDTVFAAAADATGNLHLVFTSGAQIFYQKCSSVGGALVAAVRIDGQATPSKKPFVTIDPLQTKVFVGFQSLLGPSNSQLFLATLNLNGAVITPALKLLTTATNLENICLAVSVDLSVYAAWEDTSFQRIYTQAFNDIGQSLGAAVLCSGATSRIGFATLTDGAKAPRIAVTDDQVFVTFLQNKGGAVYGLSVWSRGSAFMQALTGTGENFTNYDMVADSASDGIHLLIARVASLDYVKLAGQTVAFTLNLSTAATSSVATVRDELGSMFHVWTEAGSGLFTTYQASAHLIAIGPATLTGSVTNVTLTNKQFLLRVSEFSSRTPAAGDQVTISGSAISGDNSIKTLTLAQLVSQNAANDSYLVTVDTQFVAPESPSPNGRGAFAAPTGAQLDCAKSTSELALVAYSTNVLPTDVLLTRIGMPGTSILNWLRDDRPALDSDAFLVHGPHISIDYGKTTAGSVTITGGLKILDMIHNVDYALVDGTYAVAEGSALYVTLDPANQTPTLQVSPVSYVPWASPVQVLGIVKESTFNPSILLSSAGLGALDAGEGDVIGEDLPITLRQRLGITSETTYEAYPSTLVVAANDTYPEAIGKLDAQVGALEANRPKEDFFAGDGTTAQPTFTTAVSGLSWSTDNTIPDISVYIDGRRQKLYSGSGTFVDGFRKIGIQSIQIGGIVRLGSEVAIRKEGTAYGGPAAPSAGKLWSDQVDHTIVGPDGAFDVGASGARFGTGYFHTVDGDQLSITLPFATASRVKVKTSGELVTIPAGVAVAVYSDGKMYRASSSSATGKSATGILMEATAPAGSGRVLLGDFNIPGALTGLGFIPGDEVYVDDDGNYTNGLMGLSDANDSYIRVGYADCASGTASGTATDLIMIFQTISEAP